jgi:NDP-sugar pyrophosphorylase family protein
MKTILICPSERRSLAHLAESVPLVNIPMCGLTLLEYWLDHLASQKVTAVKILATDRPEQIRELVEDGARWGLKIEVIPEMNEPGVAEARDRYRPVGEEGWAPEPHDVVIADRLPAAESNALLSSYSEWFSGLLAGLAKISDSNRIGVREMRPGIWVGRRANIANTARLEGPCWIGENVRVGAHATIGPNAILENQVVAEQACEIAHSWVGPETFVGSLTRLSHSLAWGNKLINWRTSSCTVVPDAFLMCSLSQKNLQTANLSAAGRIGTFVQSTLNRPLEIWAAMREKLQR